MYRHYTAVRSVPRKLREIKGFSHKGESVKRGSTVCSTSQEQTPLTPLQTIENEIASYKNFPKTTPDTDPLVWWKGEGGRFPNLAHLAQKYLTVCGTSVPSERIFSRAGWVTNHRYRLSPENVDRLVFLANNMQ